MTRKQILIYIAVTVAAVTAAVLAIIAISGHRDAPPTPSSAPPAATLPGGPTATSAPEPTTDMTEDLLPGEHSTEHPMIDLSAFQTRAIDTVVAFTTFSSDEPATARRDRIAAAAGADSPVIEQETKLALTRHDESVDWSARAGIVGRPYAGFASQTASSYTFDVVADYWGSYGDPETDSQQARGSYQVTIAIVVGADGQPSHGPVTSITEPDYLLD